MSKTSVLTPRLRSGSSRKFSSLINAMLAPLRLRSHRPPQQHGAREHEAGLVGEAQKSVADAELLAHRASPVGVDDLRLTERVRDRADVADPDAVREPRAHRLHDRLLRREAHREKAHGPLRIDEETILLIHQHPASERIAVALIDALDARELHDIRSDSEDHAASRKGFDPDFSRVKAL